MHRFRLLRLAALIGIGALLLAGPTLAQDPDPPADPPGTASGTGTQFIVTYGDSVHFTVTTADPVEAVIHAFATTTLDITLEGIGGVTSTQVTIAGFAPEVTLHIAVDDLRSDALFTTDAAGVYSFTQDLAAPHHVMIKPFASTWYLGDTGWTPHGGLTPGTWDPLTKTATLTEDVNETIQVSGTGITLDGAERTVAGSSRAVYLLGGSALTLQNLTASGTSYGVYVSGGSGHTLQNLTASGGTHGVYVSGGSGHTLQNLTATGAGYHGVYVRTGSDHTLRNLTATGSIYGVSVYSGSAHTLRNLTATGGYDGLNLNYVQSATVVNSSFTGTLRAASITQGGNHLIYNNNFVSETGSPPIHSSSSGNVFSLPAPVGGNYWNTWCPPAQPDNNADGFVDLPYTLAAGAVDNLPYAAPSGWPTPAPEPSLPEGLVAWWSGDGHAMDLVGYHNGIIGGNVGYTVGKLGQAFDFHGGNVSFGSMSEHFGTHDFTVDWWMKTTQSAGGASILGKRPHCWGVTPMFDVRMGPEGDLYVELLDVANTPMQAWGGVNDGQWHHVAIVRHGLESAVYVDGSVMATKSDAAVVNISGTAPFALSASPCIAYPPNAAFGGQIDEVHFFNRALPLMEIVGLSGAPLVVVAPAAASYACVAEVPAASPEQAAVTGGSGTPTVTVSEASDEGTGSQASPLILTRTWTAIDEAQQAASASQTITVVDATAPALAVPAAVSVTAGPGVEPCGEVRIAVDYGAATATDACGEPVVAVSGVPEGGFPVGPTTLTWTASDAVGNTASGVQTVTVTCPVGTIAGAASQTCDGVTSGSEGAAVSLLHEGIPFRDVATGADGGYSFAEVRHGTYTVAIVPPEGYGVPTDTRLAALASDLLTVEQFPFTCLLGDIAGSVQGTCSGTTSGLLGVTVDVYREGSQGLDVLVGTMATDATGTFRFNNLALGEYSLSIVTPLGYAATGAAQAVSLTEPDGLVQAPAFGLACQPIVNQVRGMGYWKHQVNVYLTGKGSAQETLDQLLGYIDQLVEHFNQNLVNPVIVYVPGSGNTNDKLLQLQQLLTVNRGGTALDRAKQHLLPLLLNVVSAKISQTEVISDNGANVSQAITYCHDLIVDGIAGNDETAKTIAEKINEGQRVPSGMVPVSTRQITYNLTPAVEEAPTLRLERISPNPAQGAFTLEFSLAGSGAAWLEVVDVAGRQVLRREVGRLGAGRHSLGSNELGQLATGVYFIRLSEAGNAVIGRVTVVR